MQVISLRGADMAEMIPDRIKDGSSLGEKRVFNILQSLPDNYLVYHEPSINGRYPDFIVISPDSGVMTIEVKDWKPGGIVAANPKEVHYRRAGGVIRYDHPLVQARKYKYELMDRARRHVWSSELVHDQGTERSGHFIFPFGHMVIMPAMSAEVCQASSLKEVFPESQVVFRETFELWQSWAEDGAEKLAPAIARYFSPQWNFPRLSERQLYILRGVIHPEFRISKSNSSNDSFSEYDVRILDLKQELYATNIGSGHRIINGVAGSGKTIVLIARAKLLATSNRKVLFLCFNVTLKSFIKESLKSYPNVDVHHFDEWMRKNNINKKNNDTKKEDVWLRFLESMKNGVCQDSGKYDAVLIDEAQDFEPSWFSCAVEALKEPDGDLIIVADRTQGLYRTKRFTWSSVGIKAKGRTTNKLITNYRNTQEIVAIASLFGNDSSTGNPEEEMQALPVSVDHALRSGSRPILCQSSSFQQQCDRALVYLLNLLNGRWQDQNINPLKPSEIAILYPRREMSKRKLFGYFKGEVAKIAPTTWLSDKNDLDNRTLVFEETVKIQTIASAKGLQYRAVLLLWADQLPLTESTTSDDQSLFYVALTRPEDYLVINYSQPTKFIQRILASSAVEQSCIV